MEAKFVFPNHEFHRQYREITRTCPLILKYSSARYDFNTLDFKTKVFLSDDLLIKTDWFKLEEHCQFTGGINLSHYNIHLRNTFPLREVGTRMPGWLSGPTYDVDYPTAFEVLAYGVGTMRALNPPVSSFFKVMGGDGLPMVSSHKMTVKGYGLAHLTEHTVKLQMTNLIFADVYGELEQLLKLNRRVLKFYLSHLQENHKRIWEHVSNRNYWLGVYQPFWIQHVQDGMWNEPPKNTRELQKRAEFILENTYVDNHPTTIFKPLEYGFGTLGSCLD